MIRPFTVTPVLNGYVVQVGCQVLVFTSQSDLTDAIQNYLGNPDMVEKMFTEDSLNSKHLMPQTRPENYTQQQCDTAPCPPPDVNPVPPPAPPMYDRGGIGIGPGHAERYQLYMLPPLTKIANPTRKGNKRHWKIRLGNRMN